MLTSFEVDADFRLAKVMGIIAMFKATDAHQDAEAGFGLCSSSGLVAISGDGTHGAKGHHCG